MARRGQWCLLGVAACLTAAAGAVADEDFSEWREQQKEAFENFREERDRDFHKFLKEEWKAFQVYQGEVEDNAPKPDVMPTAPSEPDELAGESFPQPEVESTTLGQPLAEPDAPLAERPDGESEIDGAQEADQSKEDPIVKAPERVADKILPKGRSVGLRFLGHKLDVRVPAAWSELQLQGATRNAVASFWKSASRSSVEPVVKQLESIQQRLNLNGWGYVRVVNMLAEKATGDRNTAVATTWAVLLKSGADVRVGFSDGVLYLLYSAQEDLYETDYFEFDGTRYYVFDTEDPVNRLTSYAGDYEGTDSRINVAPNSMPNAVGTELERQLDFTFQGEQYTVEVPIRESLIQYLDTIPQLDVVRYFRAKPSPRMREYVVKPLQKAVDGRPRAEQINLLLRFVQTAFEYSTDGDQFGYENYLFPEETLFYPASDCEDRAALFAWLVRDILDLEVAVLDYPGHIATALGFDAQDSRRGNLISVDGRNLVVADPTYINANIGMVMPDFRKERPEAIPLWALR